MATKLIKKPVTGMKDILPAEMQLREYLMNLIRETYRGFGYTAIETPIVESLENLNSKSGGENEKLIFQILKRGAKLDLSTATTEKDLVDGGLRYDLTVPLVRFYANHAAELSSPFKALQIGPVFRADRPQKGRFREFYQCDIDVIGDATNLTEVELILATTTFLGKVGFSGFTVHINDRRILKAMAAYAGFPEESYDDVFISLDKMDKIGVEGVKEDLASQGFDQEAIDRYGELFTAIFDAQSKEADASEKILSLLQDTLGERLSGETKDWLSAIIRQVKAACATPFSLVFDPTLVRGMSYYTGTIFEITVDGFPGSVAGGGRYDGLLEKFTGTSTPACGFSIGFERIVTILMDEGFTVPGPEKCAFLVEKGMPEDRMAEILSEAMALRKEGRVVLVATMNKNRKFQKEQLGKEGYEEIRDFYREALKN